MKTRNAELLLATVIIARATSYIMNKTSMDFMGAMNVLGVRFLMAFIIMLVIFSRRLMKIDRKTLLSGVFVGIAFFVVMAVEMYALKFTDTSKVSFLENTAVAFVPLIQALIFLRAPSVKTMACAIITITGVGFLTLNNGFSGIGLGELLGIMSGITYAIAIIVTGKMSKNGDPLCVGIIQLGTMGVLSMAASFMFETPCLPNSPGLWGMFLYLAIVCSCFGYTLQPVAQKYVATEKAGMMCALNPIAAAIMGVVFMHEKLGITGIIGGAAIMCGILLQTYFEMHDGAAARE